MIKTIKQFLKSKGVEYSYSESQDRDYKEYYNEDDKQVASASFDYTGGYLDLTITIGKTEYNGCSDDKLISEAIQEILDNE